MKLRQVLQFLSSLPDYMLEDNLAVSSGNDENGDSEWFQAIKIGFAKDFNKEAFSEGILDPESIVLLFEE